MQNARTNYPCRIRPFLVYPGYLHMTLHMILSSLASLSSAPSVPKQLGPERDLSGGITRGQLRKDPHAWLLHAPYEKHGPPLPFPFPATVLLSVSTVT